jgi:diacylglycerol kinase family enzyme
VKQALIFVNPIAGRGRGRGFASKIGQRLERSGLRVRTFDDPPPLVDSADLGDLSSTVAAVTIGGDGTMRAAAQRLLEETGDKAANVPPIVVVPLGTANLMAKHLRLKWKMRSIDQEVADAVKTCKTVMLDAARANGRLFLLMAGVGLDATVVHELDRTRRGPIDVTSYTLPLLWALRQYDYPPLRVVVDGRCVAESVPALAFVGNVREYGTGFPILTRAASDDHLLDVCVLPCGSSMQAMRLAVLVTTGDHVSESGVVYTKGRSIQIESAKPVPVQIDGEAAGLTPLAVELLPVGLRFIVR